MPDPERRLHHRGAGRPGRRLVVEWRAPGEAWHRAETRDIGVGGAFVLGCTAAVGATLELAIPGPARPAPLTLRAVVRWASADGAGVQFLDVDIDVLLELNERLAAGGDAP